MHQAVLAHAARQPDVGRPLRFRFVRSSSAALSPGPGGVRAGVRGAGRRGVRHDRGQPPDGEQSAAARAAEAGYRRAARRERRSRSSRRSRRAAGGATAGKSASAARASRRGIATTPRRMRRRSPMAGFAPATKGAGRGRLPRPGRMKELINRGGEKIAPREVDEVLLAHPDVQRVSPLPSRTRGSVKRWVWPSCRATAPRSPSRRSRRSRQTSLADYKVPRRVAIVTDIPLGPTGEPQRIGLAERLGLEEIAPKRRAARAGVAPRTDRA